MTQKRIAIPGRTRAKQKPGACTPCPQCTVSTDAACERQLFIRTRMLHAIACVPRPSSMTVSLACFSDSPEFASTPYYGLHGYENH